jgi:hypothetical protein
MNASLPPWYVVACLAAAVVATAFWALLRSRSLQNKAKLAAVEHSTEIAPAATTAFVAILGGATALFLLVFLASLTERVGLVFRLILIVSAAFFPAMLYFLFISARRQSLFNAFTTYLGRLGLLRRWWSAGPDPDDPAKTSLALETPSSHRRRLRSYLDRFGAVYGSLPDEFCNKVLDSVTKDDNNDVDGPNLSSISSGAFDFPTLIPVLGATCLMSIGWIVTLPPAAIPPFSPSNFAAWFKDAVTPTLHPVTFAFLGAYFYSLQMVIKRFMRHDLGANAYNAISLRIVLAVIGIWVALLCFRVLGSEFEEQSPIILVASFAMGAFPLIVWQLIRASVKKFPPFQAALPSLNASQPLDAIDGMTIWHQSRFEEEDIENVPNLATVDIVDLMLSVKISPHRLIDWIDQAILLTYLDDNGKNTGSRELLKDLEQYGVRTATELELACRAASVLTSLEGEKGNRCRSVASAMCHCPNFVLVRNWRGLADCQQSKSGLALPSPHTTAIASPNGPSSALPQTQSSPEGQLNTPDGRIAA